jgi:hypothetical protein
MPDEMNFDKEKGTVTLKKGEQTKTFDLNKEEDQVSLMKLGQRGWYYDEDASKELGELRQWKTNWDTAWEAAKNDPEKRVILAKKFNAEFGDDIFTISDDAHKGKGKDGDEPRIFMDEDENSKFLETVRGLQKEIADLKKAQENTLKASQDAQLEQEAQKVIAEADALEKKYDGKDGSPKFVRQDVFNFASEHGLGNLETAYKLLNLDKLTEHVKKKTLEEYQNQIKERKKVTIETDDGSEEFQVATKSKAKTYQQLGKEAHKSAVEEGINFFTED